MKRTTIAAAIAAAFLVSAPAVFAQSTSGSTTTGGQASTGVAGANANGTGNTASGAALPGPNVARSAGDMRSNGSAKLAHRDRKFIEEAAEGGLKEVELGRLAADHASDPAVKQFGERMVKDHSDANKKLMDLAQSKGITPPTALKRSDQREVDKFAKLSGADFDRKYIDDMVKDHKHDVKEFQGEAKKAKDTDIQQFANSTLPVLEEHLQMAQSAQQQVKAARSGKSNGNSAMRTSRNETSTTSR